MFTETPFIRKKQRSEWIAKTFFGGMAAAMVIPLLGHDLHAKPVSIALRGPLRFLADGRIAIAVSNVADVPITVNIAGGNISGAVEMVIPSGELKLQLASPPLRGGGR